MWVRVVDGGIFMILVGDEVFYLIWIDFLWVSLFGFVYGFRCLDLRWWL